MHIKKTHRFELLFIRRHTLRKGDKAMHIFKSIGYNYFLYVTILLEKATELRIFVKRRLALLTDM